MTRLAARSRTHEPRARLTFDRDQIVSESANRRGPAARGSRRGLLSVVGSFTRVSVRFYLAIPPRLAHPLSESPWTRKETRERKRNRHRKRLPNSPIILSEASQRPTDERIAKARARANRVEGNRVNSILVSATPRLCLCLCLCLYLRHRPLTRTEKAKVSIKDRRAEQTGANRREPE